jgi:hypothetical protein
MTRVINVNHETPPAVDYVYCGRGSLWGNPNRVGVHGTREQCIAAYRRRILRMPGLFAQLQRVRGKTLGCHCKPLPCHVDIVAELAEMTEEQLAGCIKQNAD